MSVNRLTNDCQDENDEERNEETVVEERLDWGGRAEGGRVPGAGPGRGVEGPVLLCYCGGVAAGVLTLLPAHPTVALLPRLLHLLVPTDGLGGVRGLRRVGLVGRAAGVGVCRAGHEDRGHVLLVNLVAARALPGLLLHSQAVSLLLRLQHLLQPGVHG